MSSYLNDKPKKLIVKNIQNEIKNIQYFLHNEFGDPTFYQKIENNIVTIELLYEYTYDEFNRKQVTKIIDKLNDKVTIMEYSY